MGKINIVLPQNQRTTRYLLKEAGWEPVFDHGYPSEEEHANELHRGKIRQTQDAVIALRSMDALLHVAAGRRDVGLVGSDCVLEKPNWNIEVLASFSFGRAWGVQPPRLEVVTLNTSPIKSIKEIEPGSIFFTERPFLTKQWLRTHNIAAQEDNGNPADFRERLKSQGTVGIWEILGTTTVQLDSRCDFGVMVNESGKTRENYGLKVVGKIMDIETYLIANPASLADKDKGPRIRDLQFALEGAYKKVEQEIPKGAEINGRMNGTEEETTTLGRRL